MKPEFQGLKLKLQHYKSFGNEIQGFDSISAVNLIIGKNNSGKSALLDLVNFAVDYNSSFTGYSRRGHSPSMFLTKPLSSAEVDAVFPKATTYGGELIDAHNYGMSRVGTPVTIRYMNSSRTFVSMEPPLGTSYSNLRDNLANNIINPFFGKSFKRILADRDIKPEGEGSIQLSPNGEGATNFVKCVLTQSGLDRDWVEKEMLNALNQIFYPDAFFERIMVERMENGAWQILLEEEGKGRVSLSNSGSGLKTIFLVLINTILFPHYEKKSLSEYVFAFEELENNIHPSLERRLLRYLQEKAKNDNCLFFLTTHSNIAIDVMSKDEDAQIIHVKHDGEEARCSRVETHLEKKLVIQDLDVRASDLLQSNCIVWLEGPSDRAYFNRWVELYSNGELKENVHYQCVFTGGTLLSHYSADDDLTNSDGIPLLRINTNSIVVMDSDRKTGTTKLKPRVLKINEEIDRIGGYAWVTIGREVENYIPVEALRLLYPSAKLSDVGRYQEFAEYLAQIRPSEAKKFSKAKVGFAKAIAPLITLEMINQDKNLRNHLKKICELIKKWNQLA